jgi:hypothetical protein
VTLLALPVLAFICYTDFVSTDTYSATTQLLYKTLPPISMLVGLLGVTKSFGLMFKDPGLQQGFGL